MNMQEVKSFLSNKVSEKVFTYDMVGTNTMILYKQFESELYVLTKDGVLLTRTYIHERLTYNEFINQAQGIYKATLDKANYITSEYKPSLS